MALKAVYPEEVEKIYLRKPELVPDLDTESCLTPSPTVYHSLGPIRFDESTNAGNLRIVQNIFLEQYQLSKQDDFLHQLRLVYGDQKTVARLRSIKIRRVEETNPFESLRWLLPIPALFHLKMNWVALIHKTHYQETHSKNPSSLAYFRNLLDRKKINERKPDFFPLEEFLIHNFQGRVVAAIEAELKNESRLSFEQLLLNSTPESLNLIIAHVADRLFRPSLSGIADNEYYNHLHFMRLTLAYQTLKYAIKHADLDLLRRAIAKSCFYFNGSKQHNYAYETLYLFNLTCTDASSPELQQAILANSLINWKGQKDTWFETDRGVEFLNGDMKNIIRVRRTPNMDLDYLFEYCALNSTFYQHLQTSLQRRFDIHINSDHPDKSAAHDIKVIAAHASVSMRPTNEGKASFRATDLLSKGFEVMPVALRKFNNSDLIAAENTDNETIHGFFGWGEQNGIEE